MIIGVPKEIKTKEFRVAMVPSGVHVLTKDGHSVLVEKGAGSGSGIADNAYIQAGAQLIESTAELYARSDMLVKVKEPLVEEFSLFRQEQILFTYLHLAPNPDLTRFLLDSKVTAIAYETVQTKDGFLPLLMPMSVIAGRLAVQLGAHYLEKGNGGKGLLLSGTPGVPPGKVVIIGGGTVGQNAARMAIGINADVTLIDIDLEKLTFLCERYQNRIKTLYSTPYDIRDAVEQADLLIGAVLLAGGRAPNLVSREMIATMAPGSVVLDVSVDQGGCIETIHPTSHENPIYEVNGVLHYGVTNMPGTVSRSSTFALTNATLPFVRLLAKEGFEQVIRKNRPLYLGVNTYNGNLTNRRVAEALDLPFDKLAI